MDSLAGKATVHQLMERLVLSRQSIEKVLRDGLNLKFIEQDEQTDNYSLTPMGIEFARSPEKMRRQLFKQQCVGNSVFNQFVSFIESAREKGTPSKQAARELLNEMHLELADLTTEKLGAMLANWAEYAEIIVRVGRLCFVKEHVPEQLSMF